MTARLFEHYARYDRKATKPNWVTNLVWNDHLSVLPEPIIEITHDEWFSSGICSDNQIIASFDDILGVPHTEDPMLYDCHTDVYTDYGLVVVQIECYKSQMPNMVNITTGISNTGSWVQSQYVEGYGRLLRFFVIGLE